jgi:hypothetical protein
MKIIQVKAGSISPVSTSAATAALSDPSDKPLRAKGIGQKATKSLMIQRIRGHLDRAKTHIRNGDRRLITPEAMLWVERSVPSETNTLDILRGIEGILARGVQPLTENPKELENLRSAFAQWHQRAKELWARGAGGQLPRTAHDAARTDVTTANSSELRAAIVAIGGSL